MTKAQVGLGNVENTSDANKPISTATQNALNLKANLANPTFTGNVTAPTFTGALTGNAATATKLSSNRTFALTGDVTGTITSDLTSGFSIATTIAPNSVALGTDTTGNYAASVGVSGNGLTITGTAGEGTAFTVNSNATNANTGSTLVFRDASGNFSAGTITAKKFDLGNGWSISGSGDELQIISGSTIQSVFHNGGFYSTGEVSAYGSGSGKWWRKRFNSKCLWTTMI